MAVESNATELRTLPDVTLPNLNGEPTSVTALAKGRPCVVVFACNHCPYVQSVETELGAIAAAHPDVAWVAICSNDVETHPDDDVPGLRDQATRAGWHFDYLVDTSQDVARTFGAVCTPDFSFSMLPGISPTEAPWMTRARDNHNRWMVLTYCRPSRRHARVSRTPVASRRWVAALSGVSSSGNRE